MAAAPDQDQDQERDNSAAPRSAAKQARQRSRTALTSVATAACLIVAKLLTALATGSLAIVGSLVDSCLDLAASGANYLALRQAEVPPDANHRWGHGKAESLSGLGQAALIVGSAAILAWQSIERLLTPKALASTGVGLAVMAGSMAVSLALGLFLRRRSRRLASVALAADALHYLSDVLTNGAAIVALLAWRFLRWGWMDPLASGLIAAVLFKSAWDIIRQATDQLMDKEMAPRVRRDIVTTVVRTSPSILGVRDLRTRRSGKTVIIAMRLQLSPGLSLDAASHIARQVEANLQDVFEDCLVTIQPEPKSSE